MEITAGMMRRGYVESDGWCDTHGFAKSGKRVWVEYAPASWNDRFNVKKRSIWVDHLGDCYVLDREAEHFERLAFGDAIRGWAPVDESRPNVPTV